MSMDFPMFSLNKLNRDTQIKHFKTASEEIEIVPSAIGHATIFDKDILMYCVSYLVDAKNRGESTSRTVRIVAHDFMQMTNRSIGGDGYKRLENALIRLQGTVIKSASLERVVRDNEGRGDHFDPRRIAGYGLIESWQINWENERVENRPSRMMSIDITLPKWLYISASQTNVLKINPRYFDLTKAISRRLYELARKYCGSQPGWKIGMKKLHEKSGSESRLTEFRRMVKKSIEENLIPDYRISYIRQSDMVFASPSKGYQLLNKGIDTGDGPPTDLTPRARRARKLTAQKKTTAANKEMAEKALQPEGFYICPICDRVCKSRGGFGAHLRIHK